MLMQIYHRYVICHYSILTIFDADIYFFSTDLREHQLYYCIYRYKTHMSVGLASYNACIIFH